VLIDSVSLVGAHPPYAQAVDRLEQLQRRRSQIADALETAKNQAAAAACAAECADHRCVVGEISDTERSELKAAGTATAGRVTQLKADLRAIDAAIEQQDAEVRERSVAAERAVVLAVADEYRAVRRIVDDAKAAVRHAESAEREYAGRLLGAISGRYSPHAPAYRLPEYLAEIMRGPAVRQ
jgi:hypothetical protein